VGIRYRKSIRLGSGVRLNLSKSGLGYSFGIPGLRYSIGASGRHRTTIGIPGTGLYAVSEVGSGARRSRGTGRAPAASSRRQIIVPPTDARAYLPKPGWFASTADKRFYEGVQAYVVGEWARAANTFEACVAADPSATSAHFFAAMAGAKSDASPDRIVAHLEAVVGSDRELPDALQSKYLPSGMVELSVRVSITEHVVADVPFSSVGAALVLAELYQGEGRLSDAIGLVSQLHEANPESIAIRLSLADLLYADGDHEGVLEAASTAVNDSDLGVALLHLRAASLFAQGHRDAAFEAFRIALAKSADRDPELLKIVRYDRALAYESAGQGAKAKTDLERIYATDPAFEDVRVRLTGSP